MTAQQDLPGKFKIEPIHLRNILASCVVGMLSDLDRKVTPDELEAISAASSAFADLYRVSELESQLAELKSQVQMLAMGLAPKSA